MALVWLCALGFLLARALTDPVLEYEKAALNPLVVVLVDELELVPDLLLEEVRWDVVGQVVIAAGDVVDQVVHPLVVRACLVDVNPEADVFFVGVAGRVVEEVVQRAVVLCRVVQRSQLRVYLFCDAVLRDQRDLPEPEARVVVIVVRSVVAVLQHWPNGVERVILVVPGVEFRGKLLVIRGLFNGSCLDEMPEEHHEAHHSNRNLRTRYRLNGYQRVILKQAVLLITHEYLS